MTLLYHFFHPDDVVSARQFSDLAEGLAARGWEVTARPCNRRWDGAGGALPRREAWRGVDVRRAWRPAWRQASTFGRLANAVWMLAAWTWAAAWSRRRPREAVIVGTDPVLAPVVALPWRLLRPRAVIAIWCFDVYPDAAVAQGMLRPRSLGVRLIERLMAAAYRRCAFVADIGPCMARRLRATEPRVRLECVTPWALAEPATPDPAEPHGRPASAEAATRSAVHAGGTPVAPELAVRRELFGDAALGLLYSGSFGLAHSSEEFLELARRLRGSGAALCFAGRGHRADELRRAVAAEDENIRFAGFAPEAELAQRLAACDLHLVSLRPPWTGTVVPSKFFGALAAGRGVVFAGSPESAIAAWIREFHVGWILTAETMDATAAELRELAQHPQRLAALRDRCRRVYDKHFSRRAMLDRWDELLRAAVGVAGAPADALPEAASSPAIAANCFETPAASGGASWETPAGATP